MEVHHTVIFFFFLSLQDENFGVISAEAIDFYAVPVGENVEVRCSTSQETTRKFFCREECRRKIIIQTSRVSAQEGRFSIEWKRRQQTRSGDVSVKISQLTKSDSGRYRCGLGSSLSSASFTDIEIIVVDTRLEGNRRQPVRATTGGNFTAACFFSSTLDLRSAFFCKDRCLDNLIETTDQTVQTGRYSIRYAQFETGGFVYVSISQLTQSDSGRYTCGLTRYGFRDLSYTYEVFVADVPTTPKRNLIPSTSVPLAATTPSNHGAETPIPTKQSGTTTTETPMETEFTSVTETNRAYEDLREDKRRGSLPYEHAVYTKPNGVEIDHEYSTVTRARSHHAAEDDSGNITYSELNFTNATTASLNIAPSGRSDNVNYSSPREM
ncbi:polymeric immunoglobulin receptor-like [Labrus bergylta]|uniref:polymeric immunoglobulin receptor-like n=1 Tax=Labrus bergylta TaxID=56723 RepID=UPI003313229E